MEMFGEAIFSYTRSQAIEDGVLVDLMQPGTEDMVREAGFVYPVAVTAEVWADCIEVTPTAKRMCNSVAGRLWDVLWMLRCAIMRDGGDTVLFEVRCVMDSARPSLVRLKSICGPDDDGKPCITVMFPEQD